MSAKTVFPAKVRAATYWTSTSLIALAFLSGGVAYLGRADEPVRGMAELGYPAYVVTILGVWKVLGALALVAPRFPRLKEWAYAGIAFDLVGAAASHAAVGHPAVKVITPLVCLAIMAVSWSLRPASRTFSWGENPFRFSLLDQDQEILRLDVQSARDRASSY
jgi:uncharacterized membrane protein YphA (DoxX/SURF4 family)